MSSVPDIKDIIKKLKNDVPEIYVKAYFTVKDSKGREKRNKYALNLKTGDLIKGFTPSWIQKPNYMFVRKHTEYRNGRNPGIYLYGYRNAKVIDGNVVLSLWIYADHVNYPHTSEIQYHYGQDFDFPNDFTGKTVDEDAIANIKLSPPAIASVLIVTPNKEILVWDDKKHYGLMDRGDWSETYYLSEQLAACVRSATVAKEVPNIAYAFRQVFKMGYVGANKYVTFDSFKDVPAFMRAKAPVKKTGAKQHRVDELLSIVLPEHNAPTESVVCYADRVNEEWVVLRWYKNYDGCPYPETSRLYVNKTEAIRCISDLKGGWIYASAKLKSETFNADQVITQSDTVFDGTKLEYFKNIAIGRANRSAALYMLTNYPEFEKLYKIGLGWICNEYLEDNYQPSWYSHMTDRLGYVDLNAKNIFKMIGVNHYQVGKIQEFRERMESKYYMTSYDRRCLNSIISKMKSAFHSEQINGIDNNTFDYILGTINSLATLSNMYLHAVGKAFRLYGNDAIYFVKDYNSILTERDQHVSIRNARGWVCWAGVDRIFYDTLQMIEEYNYASELRPRFSTLEELVGHHDVMVDLINAEKAEEEAKRNARYASSFAEKHERWKKWEWDEDEQFCVVAPVAPVDIAVEGMTLRHCVKSYIPSVAHGNTNIMFIRRKGFEKTPFFTVEIDNTNSIRQVHGACNCNATEVDGMVDFIKRWSKLKKIKYIPKSANGIRAPGAF